MVTAVVDDVGVEGINVDWKIHGHTGDHLEPEPRPLSFFDESSLATIKEISDFNQADVQIGEKAKYVLTGDDMKKYNEMEGSAKAQHEQIRVRMVQGETVCVEVCNKITRVAVEWQDGSIQYNVAATSLHPINNFSTPEFFPGDFVLPKRIDEAIQQQLAPCMGVVRSVDCQTGVCDVAWCHVKDSDSTTMKEKMNGSELELSRDYIFRIGDIVVRLKPISGYVKQGSQRKFPLVGQIIKANINATVQVRWNDDSISSINPWLLHVVREGNDWKRKDDQVESCEDEFNESWLCEGKF